MNSKQKELRERGLQNARDLYEIEHRRKINKAANEGRIFLIMYAALIGCLFAGYLISKYNLI